MYGSRVATSQGGSLKARCPFSPTPMNATSMGYLRVCASWINWLQRAKHVEEGSAFLAYGRGVGVGVGVGGARPWPRSLPSPPSLSLPEFHASATGHPARV